MAPKGTALSDLASVLLGALLAPTKGLAFAGSRGRRNLLRRAEDAEEGCPPVALTSLFRKGLDQPARFEAGELSAAQDLDIPQCYTS
jgi:hypothetical protein